jgi:type VI protein secretion system component VasK
MKTWLIASVSAAVLYAIYVTVLVWRSEQYSTGQKWIQTLLVWALPFLGAMLCHAVRIWTPKPRRPNPFSITTEQQLPQVSGSPPTVD